MYHIVLIANHNLGLNLARPSYIDPQSCCNRHTFNTRSLKYLKETYYDPLLHLIYPKLSHLPLDLSIAGE